jgi:hypothetical protein
MRTISRIVANSGRSLAVQELRNWTCGTVLLSVVGGSWVVRFDLRFEGGPSFRSVAPGITRRRCLFRISSPPVLLSPIPLRPGIPVAAMASESLSAPISRILPATAASLGESVRAGADARSRAHHFRLVCNGCDGACSRPSYSRLQRLRSLVCSRPSARAW